MATPAQIIPQIEGLVGFQIGSADGGSIQGNQIVADWVQLVKAQLSLSSFRYLTDFEFTLLNDVDADGEQLTSATHLCAALCEMVTTIATDGDGWVVFSDQDSYTFAGNTALNDADVAMIHVSDVVTTGVSEFYPGIWLGGTSDDGTYSNAGINLATGLTVAADGNNNGAFALDALRVWVLFRGTI